MTLEKEDLEIIFGRPKIKVSPLFQTRQERFHLNLMGNKQDTTQPGSTDAAGTLIQVAAAVVEENGSRKGASFLDLSSKLQDLIVELAMSEKSEIDEKLAELTIWSYGLAATCKKVRDLRTATLARSPLPTLDLS